MVQADGNRYALSRFPFSRRGPTLGLGGLAVAVLAAGCGGGSPTLASRGAAATTSTAAPGTAPSTSKAVVISSSRSPRGSILTSGNTLYVLHPSQTACTAACLKVWPAVLLPSGATAATAGPGVDASKLGTVSTPVGLQVTYAGQALYWFSGDTAAGQVNGAITDVWGKWSVVVTSPASAAVVTTTSPTSATHTSAPPTTARNPATTSRTPTTTSRTTPTTSRTTPTTSRTTPTTSRAPTTTSPAPTTTAPAPTTTAPPPTTTTTAPTSGGGAF